MVSRLTKAMGALSQNDEEPTQERRKSARLNKTTAEGSTSSDGQLEEDQRIHDSGTESDEEELMTIASRHNDPLVTFRDYDDYLHWNPPRVSASPARQRDVDTESWDSFGRESGIMTGDNDSDVDGVATPTPGRRRLRNDDSSPSPGPGKRGHEDSNPMADHPIAWRLRSFNFTNSERAVKIPVRRIPVQVLINRPPIPVIYRFDHVETEIESEELVAPAPAPKRGRRNSHRPSLDFEKMVQTRIPENEISGPVTRSQNSSTTSTTSQ